GAGQVRASGAPVTLRAPAIFTAADSGAESYVRFYNAGMAPGTVTVMLYDLASGDLLTQWTSPAIPPGASPQYPIAAIESAANPKFSVPSLYSLALQSGITGSFQHVVFRPSDGLLTDMSTCDAAPPPSTALRLPNVHSSLISDPSSVVVYNTGPVAASAML